MPRINLIPAEFRPKPLLTRERTMLLLVVLELLVAFVLLNTYGDNVQPRIERLMGREPPQSPEVARAEILTTQLNNLRARLNRLTSAEKEFQARNYSWPRLLGTIFDKAPPGIQVASLREITGKVNISGEAANSTDIVTYSQILQEIPQVEKVTVLAIGGQSTGRGIAFAFRLDLKAGKLE